MTDWIFFGHRRPFASAALAVLLAECTTPVLAQPQTCPLQGDAKQSLAKELNPYKNRENAPPVAKINAAATIKAVLAPGNDLNRWGRDEGAIFEGVVVGVKVGGIESVNCHAKDAAHRDTHIELALAPDAPERQRVIVEITPRWRAKMAVISDWSTAALKKRLTGKRVRIIGWLFDDLEHKAEAENTNPGGARNWRATIWEIHPITGITVLPASAMASARASAVGAPAPPAARAAIRKRCASKRNRRCPTQARRNHAERP